MGKDKIIIRVISIVLGIGLLWSCGSRDYGEPKPVSKAPERKEERTSSTPTPVKSTEPEPVPAMEQPPRLPPPDIFKGVIQKAPSSSEIKAVQQLFDEQYTLVDKLNDYYRYRVVLVSAIAGAILVPAVWVYSQKVFVQTMKPRVKLEKPGWWQRTTKTGQKAVIGAVCGSLLGIAASQPVVRPPSYIKPPPAGQWIMAKDAR